MKLTKGILIAAAMTLAPTVAYAASSQTNFDVKLQIQTGCTAGSISASALDFGQTSGISSNIDQTTTLNVQCSSGTSYQIGLDAGAHSSDVAARKMSDGTHTVNYFLYKDSGRTANWGNTLNNDTLSGTATGAVETITVYGRVPAQNTPAAGDYSDSITATFTY